jgi:hypothetical protein
MISTCGTYNLGGSATLQLAAAVPICHSLPRRRPRRLAPFQPRPWWPSLSRRQCSLSFSSGDTSSSLIDSAAIPFLLLNGGGGNKPPPFSHWWRRQQAPFPARILIQLSWRLKGPMAGRRAQLWCGEGIAPPSWSLHVTDELYTDELEMSTGLYFSQAAKRCCAEKRILQVYILNVLDVLKIYCNCFMWMLQKKIEILHMLQ